MITYCARPPAALLAPFVEAFWYFAGPPRAHALERIMPTGAAELIINLGEDETRLYDERGHCHRMPGTVLNGVQTRYCIIDTHEQQHVAGVNFKPGGTFPFFREPACGVVNVHVPIESLWCAHTAAELRERVLSAPTPAAMFDGMEAVLMGAFANISPCRRSHPSVAFALAAFDRAPHTTTVGGVTEALGVSPRWFIERFRLEVGVTPKVYCRVRRFQRALRAANDGRPVDWTDVALSSGYFDQAHFIHDFRAFSGVTPTVYHASRTEFQNHVKFLQSDPDEV